MIAEKNKKISLGKVELIGNLNIPDKAKGIVLFAHGSGSSRLSPRNQRVADFLNKRGIATLLIDLLTEEEERIDEATRELRFNIEFLAERLFLITDWLQAHTKLKIGYFGASTGAAAALMAAAKKGSKIICCVVSRGGRPDLAQSYLAKVLSPTLLIVGEYDLEVIEFNRQAYDSLSCVKKMEIVSKASHLFEERGCMEQVAKLAADWFSLHF